MKVADLMSSDVVTIASTTSCWEAAVRMARAGVRHLPVVDSACVLIGVVTDRDLRSFVLHTLASPTAEVPLDINAVLVRTPVSRVMSTNVVCVGPGDSLALESDIIGHLSRRDVFRAREVESIVFPAA
jgi:acetoin utilization protein AcuB